MTDLSLFPSPELFTRAGGKGGVGLDSTGQETLDCKECGDVEVSSRHFYKNGECRKMARAMARNNTTPRARTSEPNADVERAIAHELARYAPTSPDMDLLEVDDWQTIKAVLDYLMSDSRTGALLSPRKRLARLQEMSKYPALQIGFACNGFFRAKGIETAKPFAYYMSIVRPSARGTGGSAQTKYRELMHERTKRDPRGFVLRGDR